MSIKTFKPTTPSRRQMTVSGFDGIDKKARPEPSLTEPLKKSSGRNSYGRITVRHRGGGNKRKYRIIDFKRDKMGSASMTVTGITWPFSSKIWDMPTFLPMIAFMCISSC